MGADEQSGSVEIPEIIDRIWENWRVAGGAGTCQGCPANWDNRSEPNLPGTPGQRTESHGIGPYYGVGSFNPDIAVLGREPGPIKKDGDRSTTDYTAKSFADRYEQDYLSIAKSSHRSLNNLKPMLKALNEDGIPVYWSQLRKCNQFPDQDLDGYDFPEEDPIRDRCCGLDEDYEGYLREELDAVAPDIVVPLGKDVTEKLLKLYGVSRPYDTFSYFTIGGESLSGLNPITHENLPFTVIPILHPSHWWTHVGDQLKERGITGKKNLYQIIGEDLCMHLQRNQQTT